jgi:predicted HicB family RNase H-like nuclease
VPEPRAGLGARKPKRPHPAAPLAAEHDRPQPGVRPPERADGEQGLVMLCVRVSPSLRRRLKLAAASSGRPVQALATDAFEAICQQHDM